MEDARSSTGGCLCGAVRYEAFGNRRNSLLCHCRMCQRASGAPFLALFFVESDKLKVTQGELRVYRFSARADRLLCADCGSPLFLQRHNQSHTRGIFVGSLDDPNSFRPELHVCVSSSMSWLDINDDAPRYPEKPEGMTPTLNYDPVTGEAEVRDG